MATSQKYISVTSREQLFTQVTAFLQNLLGKKHYFFFQRAIFFKMVRYNIFALLQGNTRKLIQIQNVEFLSQKRLPRLIFFHSQYFTELFRYSYKINIAKEEEIQTPNDVYIA